MNWRKSCKGRRIGRKPCGGCGSRRRTANNGRWASRRSGTGWCRWRRCWCSNRSSRPTCSPSNIAYRPGRSALDAIRAVHGLLSSGHTEVVDADLSGYFDSIPHAELMKCVSRRVSDGHMLGLIKLWLEMPVEETDERGRSNERPATRTRDAARRKGRRYLRCWRISTCAVHAGMEGAGARAAAGRPHRQLCGRLRDLLSRQCRRGDVAMRGMMAKLKLTVNETKTRQCRVPDETFDFLGYTFGRCYSPQTGRSYLGTRPSAKNGEASVPAPSAKPTRRNATWRDARQLVRDLNRQLVGWGNYFCLGPVSAAYQAVMRHTRWRLRQWLSRKGVIAEFRGLTRPERLSARQAGPDRPGVAPGGLSVLVGEGMSPCPRAGCGKSARPVR